MKFALNIFGREIGFELRSTLSNPDQWLTDALTGGTATNSGVAVTEQTALRMSAVYACVRVLSESIAMLPLFLYRRDGESKSRATDHRLYPLLHDQPNPEMTAFTFRQLMMAHLCLRGNAYAEIESDRLGRPIALWPVPLDQYAVIPERDKGVIRYKVRKFQDGSETFIPSERMLHLMGLSTNGLVGLSPIAQARQGIGLGLAAEEFGARFFGEGASLAGVLKHPGKLSEEAGKKLRTQWEERHGGIKKSHKTAILEEGMDYMKIGIPPEEAQFIETRQFQITDIARIFRVPPHMIAQLDRATWANIEHQSIEFVVHSLGPWLRNWEQAISWKLLTPQERQEYFSEFLVDALLRGDTQTRYAAYGTARQNGWMSANDIRRLENMDPVEGGDVYLVPLNMVPADQAGSRPPVKEIPGSARGRGNAECGPSTSSGWRNAELRSDGQGVSSRRDLAESYAPVFKDAFLRIFKRERGDIMRQARKSTVGDDALIGWIEEYYQEHPAFCAKTILPALESYADAVGRTTADETGVDWDGLPAELRDFLGEYADTFGTRESISSRMRAAAKVREAAEAEEPDRQVALEGMFDEWETNRAEIDTRHETNQAANAVVKTVFALGGIEILRWASGMTACPLYQEMDGKVVSIQGSFLSDGDSVEGDEDTPTLVADRDFGHPPLHQGCVCQVEPG